jgi:hypothetical protein
MFAPSNYLFPFAKRRTSLLECFFHGLELTRDVCCLTSVLCVCLPAVALIILLVTLPLMITCAGLVYLIFLLIDPENSVSYGIPIALIAVGVGMGAAYMCATMYVCISHRMKKNRKAILDWAYQQQHLTAAVAPVAVVYHHTTPQMEELEAQEGS